MEKVKPFQYVEFRPVLCSLLVIALSGCFPHKAGPRLAHFDSLAPQSGEQAPPFELHSIDGTRIRLENLLGDRPTVLQLGSHSCPVYRYRRFGMDTLYEKYKDKVNFLVVYTLEAHPVGAKSPYANKEWLTWWNRITGVRLPQPTTNEARRAHAKYSHDVLQIRYPMVIDDMDNRVWKAYGAASSPAFVIDADGHVALKQVWLNPKGIELVLERLLTERSVSTSGQPASAAHRSSLP